jgi:hypothetical protein
LSLPAATQNRISITYMGRLHNEPIRRTNQWKHKKVFFFKFLEGHFVLAEFNGTKSNRLKMEIWRLTKKLNGGEKFFFGQAWADASELREMAFKRTK